jgi:hypothetical protein
VFAGLINKLPGWKSSLIGSLLHLLVQEEQLALKEFEG